MAKSLPISLILLAIIAITYGRSTEYKVEQLEFSNNAKTYQRKDEAGFEASLHLNIGLNSNSDDESTGEGNTGEDCTGEGNTGEDSTGEDSTDEGNTNEGDIDEDNTDGDENQAERKSLEDLFKIGTWKRYKTDGEEELFKFHGLEQHYGYFKNLDVYIKMEKTEDGIIETYTRGVHKIVTTISGGKFDQITIDRGDGNPPSKVNNVHVIDDDLIMTFEMDGWTEIHERKYLGENKFVATTTLKRGDETHVSVDYFRRVD